MPERTAPSELAVKAAKAYKGKNWYGLTPEEQTGYAWGMERVLPTVRPVIEVEASRKAAEILEEIYPEAARLLRQAASVMEKEHGL